MMERVSADHRLGPGLRQEDVRVGAKKMKNVLG